VNILRKDLNILIYYILRKMQNHVGLDIGGTFFRAAVVNPKTGEFLGQLKTISLEDLTKSQDLIFYGKDGAIARFNRYPNNVQLKGLKKPEIIVTQRKEIGVRGAVAYYINTKKE